MPPVPSLPLQLPSVSGPVLKEAPNPLPRDSTTNQEIPFPPHWFELTWNSRVLKYTLDIITTSQPPPAAGYPLYICLHGGGIGDEIDNNKPWCGVGTAGWGWFYDSIKAFHQAQSAKPNATPQSVVLVCPRGIGDTWDLHWQPEACVLMERLITNLIQTLPPEVELLKQNAKYSNTPGLNPGASHFVNAKEVILWGFSAGGDGAFRLGPWMADRFAAVVPAAGHPGDQQFADNAANLKMCLEVGEDDHLNIGFPAIYKWSRSRVYVEMADQALLTACEKLPAAEKSQHYIHDCFVVRNDYRTDGLTRFNVGLEYMHEYWSISSYINTTQYVVSRDSFPSWLPRMKQIEAQAIHNIATTPTPPVPFIDQSQNSYKPQEISPLQWCVDQQVQRVALPNLVVWNVLWQPVAPMGSPIGWQRRFFYWLYLRVPDLVAAIDATKYQREEVRYFNANDGSVTILVRYPNAYLGIMLPDLWLQKLVVVFVGEPGQEKQIFYGTIKPQQAIRQQTANARGDADLTFAAMIYLESNNDVWSVKQETNLISPLPLS